MSYRIPFLLAVISCIILALLLEDSRKKLETINPKTIQIDSGVVVAQKQRILELEDAMRLGVIENTHLINKIAQQSKIQAKTIIVEKKIPIRTEKVIIIDTSNEMGLDTNFYVQVPLDIVAKDSWFTIIGRVDTSMFHLDTLAVLNKLSITIGEKKGKWWQKNEPLVEVKSANPHTKVEIENVTIEQKGKFWQKFLFGALIGSIGTFLLL